MGGPASLGLVVDVLWWALKAGLGKVKVPSKGVLPPRWSLVVCTVAGQGALTRVARVACCVSPCAVLNQGPARGVLVKRAHLVASVSVCCGVCFGIAVGGPLGAPDGAVLANCCPSCAVNVHR
jgi:hypothetical protein